MLFISTDQNAVIGFLVDSHEIIDIFNTRTKVTAIDSITFENKAPMFAYGTEDGQILVREDWQEHPTSFQLQPPSRINYESSRVGRINDIKFSINGNELVAVTEKGYCYKFKLYNNSYFDINDSYSKNQFELNSRAGVPLSINFTNDRKHVIITTSTREHFKVELQDFKSEQSIDDSNFNISYLETKFSYNPKVRDNFKNVSCLLGQELKFVCSGDFNGNLMIWKNVNELNENCGVLAGGHSSQINSLCLSRNQDFLFSMGSNDRTIIEWKINVTHEKAQAINDKELNSKSGNKLKTENLSEKNEDNYQSSLNDSFNNKPMESNLISPLVNKRNNNKKSFDNRNQQQISDQIIAREILFCKTNFTNNDQLTDSLTQIRGTNFKNMNGLMSDQLQKYSEEELVQKRAPEVSLKLNYVYGFEAFDRRRTLFYVHNHSVADFQTTVSPETLASLKNPNHQGNKTPADQYDTKF